MDSKKQKTIIFVSMMVSMALAGVLYSYPASDGWYETTPDRVIPDSASASRTISLGGSVFTSNIGQVDNSDIIFYISSAYGGVGFARDTVYIKGLEHVKPEETTVFDRENVLSQVADSSSDTIAQRSLVRLKFVGCNNVLPEGRERATWDNNYFYGNDQTLWRTRVPNYHTIVYENIWDGIDLVYYMNDGSLKYDFIIHPYADQGQIMVKVEGHTGLSISSEGSLNIETGLSQNIVDSNLDVFYMDNPGEKVDARFVILGDTYTFHTAGRDLARTLVIDPLVYSTFLGGSGSDKGNDVALDSDGCAYIVGTTFSTDFPLTSGAYQTTLNGDGDVFVAKLSADGNSLIYSTYLGGSDREYGTSIGVDSSGCAYVGGYTKSNNFPTTSGAYDETHNGWDDGFVVKLNIRGDGLVYSTYIGGGGITGNDRVHDLFLDGETVYITGYTESDLFPTMPHDSRHNGGKDAFVVKFNSAGSWLDYSVLIGGSYNDIGNGIAVDSSGCAYITGETTSNDFPTTGAYGNTKYEERDAFVVKLNSDGGTLAYSNYLGGDSYDLGLGIAVDSSGNAYVVGYTYSDNFPTTTGAYSTSLIGQYSAFVTKLGREGMPPVYSTYLGGSGYTYSDRAHDVIVDSSGCAYVLGSTGADDFPTTSNAYSPEYNRGNTDVFLSKLSSDGKNLEYSTYLGGMGGDSPGGMVLDADGLVTIAGITSSDNFPTTPDAYSPEYNGNDDVFVTRLSLVGDGSEVDDEDNGSDTDDENEEPTIINDPEPDPLPVFTSFKYVWDDIYDMKKEDAASENWFPPQYINDSADMVSIKLSSDDYWVYMNVSFLGPPHWNQIEWIFDFDGDGIWDMWVTARFVHFSNSISKSALIEENLGHSKNPLAGSGQQGLLYHLDFFSDDKHGFYAARVVASRTFFPQNMDDVRWAVFSYTGETGLYPATAVYDEYPQQGVEDVWESQATMGSSDVYYDVVLACDSVVEIRDSGGRSFGRRLEKNTGDGGVWYEPSELIEGLDGYEVIYSAEGTKSYKIKSSGDLEFIVHTPTDNDRYNLKVKRISRDGVEIIEAREIEGMEGQSYAFSGKWDGDDTTITVKIDEDGDGTYDKISTSTTSIMSNDRLSAAKPLATTSTTGGGGGGIAIILLLLIAGAAIFLLMKKGVIKMPVGKKKPPHHLHHYPQQHQQYSQQQYPTTQTPNNQPPQQQYPTTQPTHLPNDPPNKTDGEEKNMAE